MKYLILAIALGAFASVATAQQLNLSSPPQKEEYHPTIPIPYEDAGPDLGSFSDFVGDSEDGDHLALISPELRLGEGTTISFYEIEIECPTGGAVRCSRVYRGTDGEGIVVRIPLN